MKGNKYIKNLALEKEISQSRYVKSRSSGLCKETLLL